MSDESIRLLTEPTRALVDKVAHLQENAATPFEAAQAIMPYLGVHLVNGYAQVGLWTPELVEQGVDPSDVQFVIYRADDPVDLRAAAQTARFQRFRVPLVQDGDFLWGVVGGMIPGTRDQIGDLYHIAYRKPDGTWGSITDYLAYSIPFGSFAPVEYYDMARMQSERVDRDHFAHLDFEAAHGIGDVSRIANPTNILQIHVRYASAAGTLEGLTAIYERIAAKIRDDDPLTPAEQNYIAYDSVQLMPVEPIIEYESGPGFWQPMDDDGESDMVTVDLSAPDMTNWGYDVMMSGSPAVNPALLGSKRPDELVDFIATLHNFPGKPIKVLFDIVYGHIDNQSLPLMNAHFFAGSNMYGQNVAFENPVTRAMLIEMMRRKHNYGVDGIRVDGAQDFKNWNPETDEMIHDDDFLQLMNDIVQEVAGQTYLPWMIFEDGRPWPRDDWELASSYREVTKRMPNVWQWGPLTFAHNTPFLFTFWMMKWWRVREMAAFGREWITGCANHDTLRRGAQVPIDARVNTYLGDTLPEIISKAYDNPAAKLFDYAMAPGIPMDFINASMRAPWGFIRNTDDRWGVKVVSEEARFVDWRITEDLFNRADFFTHLKGLGFQRREQLHTFVHALDHAVQMTDYDLNLIADLMNARMASYGLPEFTVERLKRIARAWMDDVHRFCNVSHYTDNLDPVQVKYNVQLRRLRQQRPWLVDNLRSDEVLDYLYPTEGTVLYYSLRRSPDGAESLFSVVNMEGAPVTVSPLELPVAGLAQSGWQVHITTPGLQVESIADTLTLQDSEGVVFRLSETDSN